MIDFHTHILPALDDGSGSVEESLCLLREEARLGVGTVVLTPHYRADRCSPREFLEKRRRSWEALRPHLESGMPTLLLGAEVRYFEGIHMVQELELLCIEGTNLLLLEMPMGPWTGRMADTVLKLRSRGVQVVLAHVERYLRHQPTAMVRRLLAGGVFLQANVEAFAHWQSRYTMLAMAKAGQVHFLGSDCHDLMNRPPNWEKLPPKAGLVHNGARRLLQSHRSV